MQSGTVVKNPPTNSAAQETLGSVPGLGRSPGGGNGNPLWYSCLSLRTEESGGLQSVGSQSQM